jgi:hypothetical protein
VAAGIALVWWAIASFVSMARMVGYMKRELQMQNVYVGGGDYEPQSTRLRKLDDRTQPDRAYVDMLVNSSNKMNTDAIRNLGLKVESAVAIAKDAKNDALAAVALTHKKGARRG